jgi:hypothetical protein
VVVVNDRSVAAILAVLMEMVLVDLVLIRNRCFSFVERPQARVYMPQGRLMAVLEHVPDR